MIFNSAFFIRSELSAQELLALLILHDKNYELCKDHLEALRTLYGKELVHTIAGNKKTAVELKIRLTKKGRNFIRDLQIPHITEEVKELASALINLYENAEKPTGNTKKVVNLLAWFLKETEFTEDEISSEIENYLSGKEYAFTLENLLWKKPNVYAVYPDLGDSPLYKFLKK